jgi:hypothetical protein
VSHFSDLSHRKGGRRARCLGVPLANPYKSMAMLNRRHVIRRRFFRNKFLFVLLHISQTMDATWAYFTCTHRKVENGAHK